MICFGIICMLKQTYAQSDSLKFLIGLSPYFSTNYSPESLKYPVQVQNGSDEWASSNRYEKPLDVKSYVEVQLPLQFFEPLKLKNNYYLAFGTAFKLQFYEANLDYTESGRQGYQTEKIKTQDVEVCLGLSRIFFLDDQKRLLIIPEMSGYFNLYAFSSEETYDYDINDDLYPVGTSFISRNDFSLGAKVNLWVNYRLTKRMGVGLVFPKIVDTYVYTNSVPNTIDERTNGFEFTIDPVKLPRLFVFWYL